MRTSYDVIVVGAGPSGSTAANLLAQEGFAVLLLDREQFPRFHVGESLLPCDLPVFRRLGVDPGAAGYLYKAGAEFLDERISGRATYLFADALAGTHDHAYQVERSKFDHWLAERAREVGADVHYGERVTGARVEGDHVEVASTAGTYRARYFLDATGLDAFLGRRDKVCDTIEDFGLAAAFTHVMDIDPGVDRELTQTERGNVKILYAEGGWCWMIPLGNRKVSMGMVTRRKGIKPEWLDEQIERSPFLTKVTKGAHRPQRPGTLGSFSFYNKKHHGARWSCTGDSACFLDPIFSTGVSLGMLGAEHLVDVLAPALREGSEARVDLMDAHARHIGHAYDVFATLVNSFYHSNLMHSLFFSREQQQDVMLRKGLTSVLAGDLWRDDNPFQTMLMGSERRRRVLKPTLESGHAF